jgi:hypothetical protein
MKLGTRTKITLKALRDHAEGQEIDGWRDVYLDNAKTSEECTDFSLNEFRVRLARLSVLGLYRPNEHLAFWGQIKMEN